MSELIAKKVLFIDRDGVLVREGHIDCFEKIVFMPHLFQALKSISESTDYELVLVSNQDGVGTPHYPMEVFLPVHRRIMDTLRDEDIVFDEEFIDYSFPADNCPGRKPGTAMLSGYRTPLYDLSSSFMIGDRITDMMVAQGMGCRGILLTGKELSIPPELEDTVALRCDSWLDIASFLTGKNLKHRICSIERNTRETQISFTLDIDGSGKGTLKSGIGFFDHMLEQIFRHARFDVNGTVSGDLEVDEHHTVEDTAICLGEAVRKALGDKRGISRYGYDIMMMDDVVARCAIDFSGRPDLIWNVSFSRTEVGTFPVEMFSHFFKSFSDSACCNLFIEVTDGNTHHQAEAAFKSFAHALRNAVKRIPGSDELPSTKGVL